MNNTEVSCCCFQHGVSAAELKTTEMSGFFHFLILSFLCQHPAFWLLGIILKYCTGVTMHLQYEKTVKKIIPALLSRSLHRTGVPSKKLKFLTHDMLCTVSNYLTFTWIVNFGVFITWNRSVFLWVTWTCKDLLQNNYLKQQIITLLPSTLLFRWGLLRYHKLGSLEGWAVWVFLVHHLSCQLSSTPRKEQFSPALNILSPLVSALDWFPHQGLQFQCNRSHPGH